MKSRDESLESFKRIPGIKVLVASMKCGGVGEYSSSMKSPISELLQVSMLWRHHGSYV